MPSVVIIEDELPNANRLKKMLIALNDEIIFLGQLQTVKESIFWFSNNEHPDIVFLDIQLTDGLIFELLNQVEIKSQIIFTTAYDEYALKAFEVNGLDYLLKPIEAQRLEKALKKASHTLHHVNNSEIARILKNIGTEKITYRNRFLVRYRETYELVLIDEIAYFLVENKACYLITYGGRRYAIDQNMEVLEKELDPDMFFRVSRQVIVSLTSISKIHQYFNSQLKIELTPAIQEPILMSRERSSQLKKWLDNR